MIEDDAKTAAYLCKGLSEHNFIVDTTAGGDDGLHLALTGRYDLIILDILLPQRDGWSVLTELRRCEVSASILMLTAQDAVPDRVKGLELGADDYLVKPFAFSELLARVRALLRRGIPRQPEVFNLADRQVDVLRHRVQRGGTKLDLTPQEFALLSLLIRYAGEVLSRTLIAEQVWDINFHSDTNVVDVAIRRLRRKVDEPFDTQLIHTVRGVGYVLETR